MPRIQIANYSQFIDVLTGVAFHPVSDQRTGRRVGIAEVDAADAAALIARAGFKILADDEFLAMTQPPELPAPEPAAALRSQAPEPPVESSRKK